jgi:hypothetical protein
MQKYGRLTVRVRISNRDADGSIRHMCRIEDNDLDFMNPTVGIPRAHPDGKVGAQGVGDGTNHGP